MIITRLMLSSLSNRSFAVVLLLISLTISVALFLSVNRLQDTAKASFESSISGVDLIVGARSSELPILLFSVFNLGMPQKNVSWETYQDIKNTKNVSWTVPIALGDSHKGYRVVGTSRDFFTRMRTTKKQPLSFQQGEAFDDLFEVVMGHAAARDLSYKLGQNILISHGMSSVGANEHDTLPFKISGILAPTGTPIDKAIYISTEAITAIHVGWETGRQLYDTPADALRARDNTPSSVTAIFLGMDNRLRLFRLQRALNTYDEEAITAVLPGVALAQLWRLVGVADQVLRIIAWLVLFASIAGLVAMMALSINVRRREMAILRAMGASPMRICSLLIIEAGLITLVACCLGWVIVQALMLASSQIASARFGISVEMVWLTGMEALFFVGMVVAACLATLIPAFHLYRISLREGMSVAG